MNKWVKPVGWRYPRESPVHWHCYSWIRSTMDTSLAHACLCNWWGWSNPRVWQYQTAWVTRPIHQLVKYPRGPQVTVQVHHTMKDTFVSSFTHTYSAKLLPPSHLPALGLCLTEPWLLIKAAPDHILLCWLREKKVHECTNIVIKWISFLVHFRSVFQHPVIHAYYIRHLLIKKLLYHKHVSCKYLFSF